MPERRSFLAGLTALPLIGGGVALIGRPTAAAVPITENLLDSYDLWLDLERSWLRWERFGPIARAQERVASTEVVFRNRDTGALFDTSAIYDPKQRFDHDQPLPSARAAIVLAAVGCDSGSPTRHSRSN